MGALRKYEDDQDLDFSDLSDSNRSALSKAKDRWGSADVIRGNDGYNPSNLAAAESSALSDVPNSNESNTLAKESKPSNIGSNWNNNVTGGTHKSRNTSSNSQGFKSKAKNLFKKRGAMIAAGGVFGGGGLVAFLFSLSVASLAPVHIQEIITEKLNSAATAMNIRHNKILGAKFGSAKEVNNTKGLGCKTRLYCRISKVSDRNIKNLEAAGFKVNTAEGENLFGKKTVTSLEYTPAGSENPITIENKTGSIKQAIKNNPELKSAFKKGFSGRFASFLDKSWKKIKGFFRLKKAPKDTKGKSKEDIEEDVNTTANGKGKAEESSNKSKPGDSEPGDEVDEKGKKKTNSKKKGDAGADAAKNSIKEDSNLAKKFQNSRKKIGEISKNVLDKSTSAASALGVLDKICGVYTTISLAYSGIKTLRVEVLSQFALSFLSFASKIKAGEATTEEVQNLGDHLIGISSKEDEKNNKDSDSKESNTSRLKQAFAFFADSAAESEKVKSATESQGWRAIAYDDKVSSLDDSAKQYTVGVSGVLAGIMDFITSKQLGWIVRKGCKVIAAATVAVSIAVAVSAVSCFFTAGFTCLVETFGSITWWSVVLAAAGALASYLADKATDKVKEEIGKAAIDVIGGQLINKSTTGENYGNAIMSGAAGLMSKDAMGGGASALTKKQAVAFYQENERQIAEEAEEIRATRSPFDPTTRHTFLGSIVSNILPYTSQLSYVGGFVPAIASIAQRSFASITPGASAKNTANFEANMETCKDPSLTELKVATDIFCNVYTGIDMETSKLNTEDVIDKMLAGGFITEKDNDDEVKSINDAYEMKGELKKYAEVCYNRKSPLGMPASGDDDDTGETCSPEKNPNANLFAVFLTDMRIEDGMNEDFKPDDGFSGSSSSGSSGSSLAGNSSINDRAIELSWDSDHGKEVSDKQRQAIKEGNIEVAGVSEAVNNGASCDRFVAMVIRTTVDKSFPVGPVIDQTKYMESSDKFEKINATSLSDLKPGDILNVGQDTGAGAHTYIYVQLPDGTARAAQASWEQFTGRHDLPPSLTDSLGRGNYTVFRYKG